MKVLIYILGIFISACIAEKCRSSGECGVNCECIGFTNGVGGVVGYHEGNCVCNDIQYLTGDEKQCKAKIQQSDCGSKTFFNYVDNVCFCSSANCDKLINKLRGCSNAKRLANLPPCPKGIPESIKKRICNDKPVDVKAACSGYESLLKDCAV